MLRVLVLADKVTADEPLPTYSAASVIVVAPVDSTASMLEMFVNQFTVVPAAILTVSFPAPPSTVSNLVRLAAANTKLSPPA